MNWFTSDMHFGHGNIIKYCNRPFKDLAEMQSTLVLNWMQTIGQDDTVFHLGDFSFMGRENTMRLLASLSGNKIFFKGNHQGHPKTIIDSMIIRHEGHRIHLNHYPELASPLMMSLVGHVHQNWKVQYHINTDGSRGFPIVNVGIDAWNFRPVSLDEIIKYLKEDNNAEYMRTMHFAERDVIIERDVRYDKKEIKNEI